MREDIARAYALLDSKGQASITGMRAPANVKKASQKLDEFLPDEQVLAVAAGSEPTRSFVEKALYGHESQ
jgi:hypothetical protein